jgi:hypothetical protein
MPEANQYLFSNKELLELLIKQADLHEGRWTLMANFGVSPGSIGPTPEQAAPGVAIFVSQIGITRAQKDTPEAISADATIVNSRQSSKKVR